MKKLLLAITIGSSFALSAPVHAGGDRSSGGSVGYDQQGTSGGYGQQGGGFNQQNMPGGFNQQGTTGGFNQQGAGGFNQQNMQRGFDQPATSGAFGQQQANNPAMQGRRAVIGEVIDMREVQVRGANTKHRLVKIRNQQGQNMVVNLGDVNRAPGDDFKRGTQIVAIGKEARINGDPVLFARYVGDLQQAGGLGMRRQ